jgi:ribonuclease HI
VKNKISNDNIEALYKKELQNMALKLQSELEKQKIKAYLDDNSFRDYLVKLTVSINCIPMGSLSIYYKPTKNTYYLKKQITESEIDTVIDLSWDKVNNVTGHCFTDSSIYEAFVDGSYISGITSYGAIIYLGNEIKTKISGTISYIQFRQFGGELKAVIETLKWCHRNKIRKISINYDYHGIEKFITGEWRPRNILSVKYVDFVRKAKIEIKWRHIKSHTGNIKNNEADLLAKKAAMKKVNKF